MNYGIYKLVSKGMLVLSFTAASAYAVDPTPTPKPGSTQAEIGAQVNIIHDSIEDALRKMDDRKGDTNFKAKDYWKQVDGFKKNVESAMDDFRIKMGDEKSGILGRIAQTINRYNSIAMSESFSADQKPILLQGALDFINEQNKGLQELYAQEIENVYKKIFGNLPMKIQMDLFGVNSAEFKTNDCKDKSRITQTHYIRASLYGLRDNVLASRGSCAYYQRSDAPILSDRHVSRGSWRDGDVLGNTDVPEGFLISGGVSALYAKYFYPLVSKGCETEICLGMRAGDLVFVLNLVQSTINRKITINLAKPVGLKSYEPAQVVYKAVPFVPTWTNSMISKTDYPAKLPFDTE